MITNFKFCLLVILFSKYGFPTANSLSQIVQNKNVTGVKIWTQVHKHDNFKEYHVHSINHEKFLNDTVFIEDTIFCIYGKKVARYLVKNIILDTTFIPMPIEKCGDIEDRNIAFEFTCSNGQVINLLFDLKKSLKSLNVYTSNNVVRSAIIINKEIVLPYIKDIIDTTCYGFIGCSGYCFKFYKPHFIRTDLFQKEQFENVRIENQRKDSIKIYKAILNEIQLNVEHLNNFDQNILKEIVNVNYKTIDSNTSYLTNQILSLKENAKKHGLNILWCDRDGKFFLEWYKYPGVNAKEIIDSLEIKSMEK